MKYKKIIWGILGITIMILLGFTSNDNRFQYIFNKLKNYSEYENPEKVYLHTDKQYYTNGETIWLKSYLVNGITHQFSEKSKIVYVELIDSKDSIVVRRTLHTDNIGASGDIKIGADWQEGNYILRSYTNYMRNFENPVFFQKDIPIWNQEITDKEFNQPLSDSLIVDALRTTEEQLQYRKISKPKVEFYPEGGDLVSGIENTLGIKTTDASGKGMPLLGSIKDENGNNVVFFRTYTYGLGKVAFIPRPNKKYTAHITINGKEEQYLVPKSLEKGYRLSVINNGDHIILNVKSTTKNNLYGTLLMGHLRGKLFYKHIESQKNNNYSVKLITKEFNDGVAHFTLFTPYGEAVCERLTFIDNPENDVNLNIVPDKKEYKKRDLVSIKVGLQDKEGNPLQGNFSMGVTNSTIHKSTTGDIRSWLLIDSDLKGTIEDPGYFFEKSKDKRRKYLLDALMLTHGWRRFVWKEFLHNEKPKKIDFSIEKGVMINGKTTDFNKPFATKQTFAKISFLGDKVFQEEQLTSKQGRFSFGPYMLKDSVDIVLEAAFPDMKNKERSRNTSIFIDAPLPGPTVERASKVKKGYFPSEDIKQYLAESRRKKITDFQYNGKITQLEEVILKAKKKTLREKLDEEINSITPYGQARRRVFPDSMPGASSLGVIDLLQFIPGVSVFGLFPNQQVSIRGGGLSSPTINSQNPQSLGQPSLSGPLFLVDGVEVPIDFVNQILASEVSFIDVLFPEEAITFGSRGSQGAIAIYTYRGFNFSQNQKQTPGVTNFKNPGFYQVREFFAPDYSIEKSGHIKPDYRPTIHWEPNIIIKENGAKVLSFYSSDDVGKYLVRIEGITQDGRAVTQTQEITVLD